MKPAANPTVAVVVIARNEARLINRCIGSLARQSRMPDKVVLVDDGSTDNTVALARAELPSIEVLSRHTRSLAQNRNDGWKEAGTDYVAYLDADCEAPAEWLENLLAAAIETGAEVVGGGNRPPLNEGAHFAALAIMLDGFLGSRGSVQGTVPHDRREVAHLPTLNVLYRTTTLQQVGGFDPNFGQVGEDEDLSRRIRAVGGRLLAIPDATVIHRQRADVVSWARNMYKYGKGRTWLLRRHPNAFSPVFLVPPMMWPLLPIYLPLIALVSIWMALMARKPLLAPRILRLFIATHLPYAAGQISAFVHMSAKGKQRRRRVAVLALKNAGNKGDEAIMHSVCSRLANENASPEIYLGALGPSGFDIRPLPIRLAALDALILDQLGPRDDARRLRPLTLLTDAFRAIITFIRFDNVFIGGGQWLHDLSFTRHVIICALFSLGRLFGTRVGVFCVGVGPLSRPVSRRLVRMAFGANAMMVVRDKHSAQLLADCGMRNVSVATDPVVELEPEPVSRDESRVLISPCAWTRFDNLYSQDNSTMTETVRNLSVLVEGLRKQGCDVAFLPTMNPEDTAIADEVSRTCGGVNVIRTELMTPAEVQREIDRAGLLISMRLHPVIFASNTRTPVIALNYAAKVRAFCQQAEIEAHMLSLDDPEWAKNVLAATRTYDRKSYSARLAASRPEMLRRITSAYSTLSLWLRGETQRAEKIRPTPQPTHQTKENTDAYRLH